MKKPQKKPKGGIALELIWIVYRLSNLLQKSYVKGFPRIETKIGKRWKSETYQKEQRAVKKLSTDLLDGMSPSDTFGGLEQRRLRPHFSRSCTVPIEAPTIHSPIQFIDTTCCMS